jgi:MoaA/NifB/PqqE/SkfB family radical SAM enzyme
MWQRVREIPVRLRGRGRPPAGVDRPWGACAAPSIQLQFAPNGDVAVCCQSLETLGNIRDNRLLDLWNSPRRREIVARLTRDDYSMGCEACGAEVDLEGRKGSFPEQFDAWADHLHDPGAGRWPTRLDFMLSNACNLQCVQCSGDYSSSIRIHREHRPPLEPAYGDEFFTDVRAFLPHLHHASFEGGEPFLGAENYRMWDLIAEVAPDLRCTVCTNATTWNRRVERAISSVRMGFIFSLDGITPETFESIRIGASLDEVLANIDRFTEHAHRIGTDVSINHCLMPQNAEEFPQLLSYAEARGIFVNVSVVRGPVHCSIARLPADEIRALHRSLLTSDDEMSSRLVLNRRTWVQELARIGAWAQAGESDQASVWEQTGRTVLMFRCAGDGPHDEADAVAELIALSCDGEVSTVVVGRDDLIRSSDRRIESLAGVAPGGLTGQQVQVLQGLLSRFEELDSGPDRVDALATFGQERHRVAIVARRDGSGWADDAVLVFARLAN